MCVQVTRIPHLAATPVAAMTAVGVARPRAQGQAISKTFKPCSNTKKAFPTLGTSIFCLEVVVWWWIFRFVSVGVRRITMCTYIYKSRHITRVPVCGLQTAGFNFLKRWKLQVNRLVDNDLKNNISRTWTCSTKHDPGRGRNEWGQVTRMGFCYFPTGQHKHHK